MISIKMDHFQIKMILWLACVSKWHQFTSIWLLLQTTRSWCSCTASSKAIWMILLMRGINAVVLVLGLVSAAVWLTPRFVQKIALDESTRDTSLRATAEANSASALFEIVSRSRIERMRRDLREDLCRHRSRLRCIGTYCFTPPVLTSVQCATPNLLAG